MRVISGAIRRRCVRLYATGIEKQAAKHPALNTVAEEAEGRSEAANENAPLDSWTNVIGFDKRSLVVNHKIPEEIEGSLALDTLDDSTLATYFAPLRRTKTYGIPVAQLNLQSYSAQALTFYSDFCMRAAYYLGIPASGPVSLPRKTERVSLPRGPFAHTKTPDNWERVTLKRLIVLYDAPLESVEKWMNYCSRYQFYGVALKGTVFNFEALPPASSAHPEPSEDSNDHSKQTHETDAV